MRGKLAGRCMLSALVMVLAPALTWGADSSLVSSMRNVNAVMEAQGFRINPAFSQGAAMNKEDLSPPQAFEILRPEFKGFTIGRLFTSCTCIQLESPKRKFEDGERAIMQLRNIRPTPPNGQIYAIYVQITSPVRVTLRFDTFVQSNVPGMATEGDKDDVDAIRMADSGSEDESGKAEDLADADILRNPESFEMIVPSAGTATTIQSDAALTHEEIDLALDVPAIPPPAIASSGISSEENPDFATETQAAYDEVMKAMEGFDEGQIPVSHTLAGAYSESARDAVAAEVDARVTAVTVAANAAIAAPQIPEPLPPPTEEIDEAAEFEGTANADTSTGDFAATPQPVASPASAAPSPRPQTSEAPLAFISLLTIGVTDLGRAMDFYEALGWKMAPRGKYDQAAMFQLNGQVMVLYPIPELLREQNMQGAAPSPGGITLAIHVQNKDEVRAVYQRFIDAGGTSLKEPTEMLSGSVTGYVADPDGNPWEISWVPRFRVDTDGRLWLP